ncbi:sulfotransferase 1 family member D1-like [Ruditapes philippinarum]|uniref:sulfotransferase 1 family member D1-like n=1 Tax=Ruditapes philippinarum TaxID=129788 RepID=UPI00295BEC71|nr:sulfotransferase 1 family member D1-like [Ruditapes philippinarum]
MELPTRKEVHVPLRIYKGTCVFDPCETEAIQSMSVYDDDVWVLTFPRSGTTVVQEIVYLLMTKLDFKTANSSPLDKRFPFLDLVLPDMPYFRGLKGVEEQSQPRLIKSHLHYKVLPESLYKSQCKKIYVMRNPKDVFVSGYMLTQFFNQLESDVTMKTYLDDWLDGKVYNTPWWLHVRAFWENRNEINNILYLKYEDIVKDMTGTIYQIAEHLKVDVTAEQVDKIAEHCSFSKMKASKTTNAGWMLDHWKVDKQFVGHIRKGKVGDWRNHITTEMSEKIDKMVKEKLSDLDLEFDFGQ